MSTAVASPMARLERTAIVLRNDHVLLNGVTWEMYFQLRENPENRGVRMYYSDGELLLMTVGYPHERIRILLSIMLQTWCEETDSPVMCFGQWTLQKEEALKGLESDNCFYVSSVPRVVGKRDLDLASDPPPDFALEIDITTNSQLKFDIYAAIGVSEIWIWEDSAVVVYRLKEGRYERVDASVEFPGFPLESAVSMILDHAFDADTTVARRFREAIQR